jgi:hypothetical protein
VAGILVVEDGDTRRVWWQTVFIEIIRVGGAVDLRIGRADRQDVVEAWLPASEYSSGLRNPKFLRWPCSASAAMPATRGVDWLVPSPMNEVRVVFPVLGSVGKTGTYLHLRHEIGLVEAAGANGYGARVAMAALTRTARPAAVAPDVALAIGDAARTAFDELRGSGVMT